MLVKNQIKDDIFLSIESEVNQVKNFFNESKKDYIKRIKDNFRKNFYDSKISINAKKLFPFFENATWVENYLSAIGAEEQDGIYYIYFDTDVLKKFDMPESLPEMLEFGHPIGIQAVKHFRLEDYETSDYKLRKKITR